MKKRLKQTHVFIFMAIAFIAITAISTSAIGNDFISAPNDPNVMALKLFTDTANQQAAKLYIKLTQFPYEYGWNPGLSFYYVYLFGNKYTLVENQNPVPFVDRYFSVSDYNVGDLFRIPLTGEVPMAPGFYTFEASLVGKNGTPIPGYEPKSVTFAHNCSDKKCADFNRHCSEKTEYSKNLKCFDGDGKSGDVRVHLRWSDCNDLDLHVYDPCGNKIYYKHTQSTCDGLVGELDVDANKNAVICSLDPQENIVWEHAPKGNYKVQLKYYKKHSQGTNSSSYVITVFNGNQRTEYSDKLNEDELKDIVEFTYNPSN
ncbi:MAG: hypothetical protein HQK67_02690 [Desulfamplus sp.]|nr:hypothetical protein [Desulfamplus sp.]